jgi:hypothetical protein
MLWVRLTRGIQTRQTIRAWPGGTYYEQNADSVKLRSPGNLTFPSSFTVSKNTPLWDCNAATRDHEDTEFGDPEHIEFDTDDLIDAAVGVYLNPRKSSPTIRDPRQFELTLEDLRRRAGIGRGNRHLGGIASIAADRFRLSSRLYAPNRCSPIASVSPSSMLPPSTTSQ